MVIVICVNKLVVQIVTCILTLKGCLMKQFTQLVQLNTELKTGMMTNKCKSY